MSDIRILVDDAVNRKPLEELVKQKYDVAEEAFEEIKDGRDKTDSSGGSVDRGADLYLVDDHSFHRYYGSLRRMKDGNDVFTPVVLLKRDGTELVSKDGFIDEFISVPVDTEVFFSRIDNLLRRREQSLDLHRKYRRSKSKFEAIFNTTYQFTGLLEEDGTVVEINDAALDFADVDHGEVVGEFIWETCWWKEDAERQEKMRDAVENARDGEFVRYEERLEGEDGEVYVDFSLRRLEGDMGEEYIVFEGRDIPEKKERELWLRELKKAVESLDHAIYITDTEGTITYVNSAFEEITGYSREEAEGRNANILKSEEMPESYYEDLWETIKSGEIWKEEIIDRRKDGEKYIIEQTIVPVKDEDGEIEGFAAIQDDITRRKLKEKKLEEMNKELREINRIMRHDVGNDMQVILTQVKMLREEFAPEKSEEFDTVIDRAQHVLDMTGSLRKIMESVVSGGSLELTKIDLKPILEKEIETWQDDPNVEIEVDEIPDTEVCANDMLSVVFRNVLNNAVKHNDKQTPEIEVWVEEKGDTVEVKIADNGPGFPDEVEKDVYGQALKQKGGTGPQTGFGIFLIKRLVNDYHGKIKIQDNQPEGSVFSIELNKKSPEKQTLVL